MKRWLVICNERFYPSEADDDWVKVYSDEDKHKAVAMVEKLHDPDNDIHAHLVDLWKWLDR